MAGKPLDSPPDGSDILLASFNLRKYFPIRGGLFSTHVGDVQAVDGISLTVRRGETVGLVGESGCGKTTVGRLLLRLIEPTSGHAFYRPPADIYARLEQLYATLQPYAGADNGSTKLPPDAKQALSELDKLAQQYSIFRKSHRQMSVLRSKFQIVFQDPFSSLGPRLLVRDIIAEPLECHHVGKASERNRRVLELLADVGLNPEHMWRFPHEFSGGQRQRICIARALAGEVDVILADEPTAALDTHTALEIMALLKELTRKAHKAAYVVTHDTRLERFATRVDHITDGVLTLGSASLEPQMNTDQHR